MINDKQTNKLYLSDKLASFYPKFYYHFTEALLEHEINFEFLKGTKDVWCRDFMPIQLDEKRFVQFIYDPWYLKKASQKKYKTNPTELYEQLGIEVKQVDLVLDGGNRIHYNNLAIVTERVFEENPDLGKNDVRKILIDTLELEKLIIIPCMSKDDDMTGHADGYLRLINEEMAFFQRLPVEFKSLQKRIIIEMAKAEIACCYVPEPSMNIEDGMDASGCFVNYLEIGDNLFIPYFNKEEDLKTLKIIAGLHRGKYWSGVDCTGIAKQGGLLNCVSWNIKST